MSEEVKAKLDAIERNTLLAAKNVFTIDDMVTITGITKQSLYRMTCQNKIPYYRPMGGKIYFDRKEIEDWLKRNRVATTEEVNAEAATYCVTHKRY